METDHIVPREQGGTDDIENAIPVCFECHAEIHSYNDQHPRGRKFQPEELRHHREQWLSICNERPDVLVTAPRHIDVGPIQALLDELEFNQQVAERPSSDVQGCHFRDDQFRRAIQAGSVALLRDEVKGALVGAYVAIGAINSLIDASWHHPKGGNAWATGVNEVSERIRKAQPVIAQAHDQLLEFLRPEPGSGA
jgi:hypothetical protein